MLYKGIPGNHIHNNSLKILHCGDKSNTSFKVLKALMKIALQRKAAAKHVVWWGVPPQNIASLHHSLHSCNTSSCTNGHFGTKKVMKKNFSESLFLNNLIHAAALFFCKGVSKSLAFLYLC